MVFTTLYEFDRDERTSGVFRFLHRRHGELRLPRAWLTASALPRLRLEGSAKVGTEHRVGLDVVVREGKVDASASSSTVVFDDARLAWMKLLDDISASRP